MFQKVHFLRFVGGIKMKIIALRGESNSGKTTVLKMLIDQLLKEKERDKKEKKIKVDIEFADSRFRPETIKKMLNPKDDKWFTTKEKTNISNLTVTFVTEKGKCITITSMGDAKELILGSLKNAEKRLKKKGITNSEPDVYICACHPRMNIEKMLNCKDVTYIEKKKIPEEKREDSEVVDIIISELNKSI